MVPSGVGATVETGSGGLYWGYIGIMEKKMETTIMGLDRVLWDSGK